MINNDINKINFNNNGFFIIKKFFDLKSLEKINLELDKLFNSFLLNGYNRGSIILNNLYTRKAVTTPCINIYSINIMELIIDVFNVVVDDERKKNNYVVSNVMIYSEIGNPDPLKFHTDGRKGMIRAQIYLRGGEKNSGGFRYIKNSNLIKHNVFHELSEKDLKKYDKDLVDLTGSEGDLIAFDPYGFHGKYPCNDERRTLLFEFQPRDADFFKSQIDFCGALLTKKVLSNINLFIHNNRKNDHYLDLYKNSYILNFKILIYHMFNATKLTTKKFLNDFKIKVKNKLSKR